MATKHSGFQVVSKSPQATESSYPDWKGSMCFASLLVFESCALQAARASISSELPCSAGDTCYEGTRIRANALTDTQRRPIAIYTDA